MGPVEVVPLDRPGLASADQQPREFIEIVQIRPPGQIPSGGSGTPGSAAAPRAEAASPAADKVSAIASTAPPSVPLSAPLAQGVTLELALAQLSPVAVPPMAEIVGVGSDATARPNRGILHADPTEPEKRPLRSPTSAWGAGDMGALSGGLGGGIGGGTSRGPGTDCITAGSFPRGKGGIGGLIGTGRGSGRPHRGW